MDMELNIPYWITDTERAPWTHGFTDLSPLFTSCITLCKTIPRILQHIARSLILFNIGVIVCNSRVHSNVV